MPLRALRFRNAMQIFRCKTYSYISLYIFLIRKNQKRQTRDKLVLMSWCPDEVKVRSKFIHAASVEGMKKAVGGYSAFVQVVMRRIRKTRTLFVFQPPFL